MKNNKEFKQGYYLDLANGEFIHLDGANAILAPYARGKLIRVPPIVVMLGAPVIGLAYVIFLPLAGIAGMVAWLGRKAAQLVTAPFHPRHEKAGGDFRIKKAQISKIMEQVIPRKTNAVRQP